MERRKVKPSRRNPRFESERAEEPTSSFGLKRPLMLTTEEAEETSNSPLKRLRFEDDTQAQNVPQRTQPMQMQENPTLKYFQDQKFKRDSCKKNIAANRMQSLREKLLKSSTENPDPLKPDKSDAKTSTKSFHFEYPSSISTQSNISPLFNVSKSLETFKIPLKNKSTQPVTPFPTVTQSNTSLLFNPFYSNSPFSKPSETFTTPLALKSDKLTQPVKSVTAVTQSGASNIPIFNAKSGQKEFLSAIKHAASKSHKESLVNQYQIPKSSANSSKFGTGKSLGQPSKKASQSNKYKKNSNNNNVFASTSQYSHSGKNPISKPANKQSVLPAQKSNFSQPSKFSSSAKASVQNRLLKFNKGSQNVPFNSSKLVSESVKSVFFNETNNEVAPALMGDNSESFCEEMDWEPVTEAEIVDEINQVRKSIPKTVSGKTSSLFNTSVIGENLSTSNRSLSVIVDTNVFISNLKVIQDIAAINLPVAFKPTIVIPWMVIQELDYLKDNNSNKALKSNAQTAIKFINKLLTERSPALKCQTSMQAAENKSLTKKSDDEILHCCLKYFEKTETILLSNDINLRNKALIHNVNAYSSKDVLNYILHDYKNALQLPKVAKIKTEMINLCDFVIQNELKRVYGAGYKNTKYSSMIYTVEECLECFKYHWKGVFSRNLQMNCLQVVTDFHAFLESTNFINNDENFVPFMQYCFSLAVHLKTGYVDYREKVSEAIGKLQNLADS